LFGEACDRNGASKTCPRPVAGLRFLNFGCEDRQSNKISKNKVYPKNYENHQNDAVMRWALGQSSTFPTGRLWCVPRFSGIIVARKRFAWGKSARLFRLKSNGNFTPM
jgi:hypothetical protein